MSTMPLPARTLLLALLLAAPVARAQVNTEAMRNHEVWTGLRGEIGGTLAIATGNTDYFQLGIAGRTDLRRPHDGSFVVGELLFSKAGGERFADRSFIHARHTRPLVGPLSAEAFAQVERNAQQLLEQRYLLGAGLRLSTPDGPPVGLAVGLTPMFEHERLSEAAMEAPASAIRVSSYVSARYALSGHIDLTATVYAQPRVGEFSDVRLLGQGVLQVQASRFIALRTELRVRRDSHPPTDVEGTDLFIQNGLVLTLPGR